MVLNQSISVIRIRTVATELLTINKRKGFSLIVTVEVDSSSMPGQ